MMERLQNRHDRYRRVRRERSIAASYFLKKAILKMKNKRVVAFVFAASVPELCARVRGWLVTGSHALEDERLR